MKLKTLDDFDFSGKKVLLRVDINSNVFNGKVLASERIREASITIMELKQKNAKIVIIAHQGNRGKEDFVSLKQHSILINEIVKIDFIEDIVGGRAIKSIGELKNGEAILLENLRFLDEEIDISKKPNRILELGKLFDIYVNDAFSNSHREHSSMVLLPKIIKNNCIGRTFEKEINAIERISIDNCIYILGGAKPEENIKLLNGKRVLTCGLFGQLCLVSKGINLGYQNEFLKKATLIKKDYNKFLISLKSKLKNVETPIDLAVSDNGKRVEYNLKDFPLDLEIEDIGEKTIKKFIEIIKNADAIYMKGPAGNVSEKQFLYGTAELLKAISECKGFTLIGGGHLADAISNLNINKKKFGYVSLSGGALLTFISGEKLPGLESLRYYD